MKPNLPYFHHDLRAEVLPVPLDFSGSIEHGTFYRVQLLIGTLWDTYIYIYGYIMIYYDDIMIYWDMM